MRYAEFEVSANVSLLFTEFDYPLRFAAAAEAGFRSVETWWPFATPTPSAREVDDFIGGIERAGVRLTGLNFWGGDLPGGDRGVAAIPERADELRANVPVVVDIARRTGCRFFNLLYGKAGADLEAAHVAAATVISEAADAVSGFGGTVLLEPLAAELNRGYPLHTLAGAADVIDTRLGSRPEVRLLFDTFHLASNGADLMAEANRWADRVGHVQFADAPGRGEPGAGSVPIREVLQALRAAGYSGSVAAEYIPTRSTAETLGWAH